MATDARPTATQSVAGEGPKRARIVLVGEQPGDREDRDGRPFVGPVGRLLDDALERAGIPRTDAYVTNAVKHFRDKLRGKRRIHQTPDRWQVNACLPWLRAELDVVGPDALVALGATAGQALFGAHLRIGRDRATRLDCELAPLCTVSDLRWVADQLP
jgi:uracil-DNA glycosylase